jgi:2-dehydro-3-deoxyglucarate aldolase/4-hydroxy-2-oxoheptanedioate aldolase
MNVTALRERKLQLGTWLSLGSSVVAELAAESGFDWLLFDLEHGCGAEAALLPQLQAIRGASAAAIVRVGAPYPDLIARALDWGADGIMVPHVSTVTEAEACVRAMHYPPRGQRGFSRSVRAYGYGRRPPAEGVTPTPVLFAQIETIEAVENAQAIAEVEGVDVLFVGPADLQFDLKARPSLARRDYRGCLEHVAAASRAAGKSCGLLIRQPSDIEDSRKLGFTHLAMDSDMAILRRGYQDILDGLRGSREG